MTSAVAAGPVGEVWPVDVAAGAGAGLVAGGPDEAGPNGRVDVAGVVVFVVGGWMARWTDVEGSMEWLTAEKVDLILKLVGGLVTLVGGFVCLRLLPALTEYRRTAAPLHAAEVVTMACKKAASAAQAALVSFAEKERAEGGSTLVVPPRAPSKAVRDAAMEVAIQVAVEYANEAQVGAVYTRGQVVDAVKTYVSRKVPGMGA